jgi:hypothetical protein
LSLRQGAVERHTIAETAQRFKKLKTKFNDYLRAVAISYYAARWS